MDLGAESKNKVAEREARAPVPHCGQSQSQGKIFHFVSLDTEQLEVPLSRSDAGLGKWSFFGLCLDSSRSLAYPPAGGLWDPWHICTNTGLLLMV